LSHVYSYKISEESLKTSTTMKGILRFLWIALALAGKVAARDTRGINTPSRLLLVNDGQSKTDAAMDAVCTQGLPASAQHPDSDYPIENYTVVTPAQHWSSYTLRQDWYDEHYLSGPHVSQERGTLTPFTVG
jgi:hypothetical protein